MQHVVRNVNVLAEKLDANSVIQKRSLVENGNAAVITEHESDYIEHRRRLKYDSVFSGRNFLRMPRSNRLLRRCLGQSLWIENAHVGGIRFLPPGRVVSQHTDG